VVDRIVGTAQAEAEPLSTAVTLGINKMEALFDNHKVYELFQVEDWHVRERWCPTHQRKSFQQRQQNL